jgi:pilus assembly protein Flp/PilA
LNDFLRAPAAFRYLQCYSNYLRSLIDMRIIVAFLRDHSGATSIEYAAIASMIAVAVVAGVNNLGSAVKSNYTSVSVALK